MQAIRNALAQQSHMLNRAVRTTDAHALFNLQTDDSTLDQAEVQLPMHRERLLPPTETLAIFLAQVSYYHRQASKIRPSGVSLIGTARAAASGKCETNTRTGIWNFVRKKKISLIV